MWPLAKTSCCSRPYSTLDSSVFVEILLSPFQVLVPVLIVCLSFVFAF